MGRALAVVIWLITLGSVGLFLSGRWWFPPLISVHGAGIDRQFIITIIVVGLSFAAAQIALGYAVWRYGDRADGTRAVYSHGNNRLEMTWTAITALIFIGLGVLGQQVWAQLHFREAPAGSYPVHVVAQQFQWNFHYAGADGQFGKTDPSRISDASLNFIGLDENEPTAKDDAVVSTLAIPVNRPVALTLTAKDVTHSFWVPGLRMKQDLVPGLSIPIHFTATKVGKYEIACVELCGQLHYKMKAFLLVLPEEEMRELSALTQDRFQSRISELLKKYPL